uniref:Uncharacterized protein n=1 Tax=Arundo donax TaxID=35708 RepID=A0A0A8Y5J0_ARUDO
MTLAVKSVKGKKD